MKKFFSILLAGLVIVSSIHLTIATHYCGDNFKGFKVSVNGEKASCGMESTAPVCTNHKSINHNCCTDKIASYFITDDFFSKAFHFIKLAQCNFISFIGIANIFKYHTPDSLIQITHSPPGEYLPNMVKLASICIFRK